MQHDHDFNPLGARLDATTTKGARLMMTDPADLEVGALLSGASMGMRGKIQRSRRIADENPGDANVVATQSERGFISSLETSFVDG